MSNHETPEEYYLDTLETLRGIRDSELLQEDYKYTEMVYELDYAVWELLEYDGAPMAMALAGAGKSLILSMYK